MQLHQARPTLDRYSATVVGVSVDSPSTSAALAARLEIDTPLAADEDLAVARSYGVEHVGKDLALPATIVIRRDGTVAWIYVGDNPRDRPQIEAMLTSIEPTDS